AARAFFGCGGHAFLAQAQLLPALRARGNPQLRPPIDGRDFDFGSECGLHRCDRNLNVNVIGNAPEYRMLTDADDDVEVSRGATVRPGIAFAWNADTLSVARAGFHTYLQRFGALNDSVAMTGRADALRLPRSTAARAGDVEFHTPAGLGHLAFASAFRTCTH